MQAGDFDEDTVIGPSSAPPSAGAGEPDEDTVVHAPAHSLATPRASVPVPARAPEPSHSALPELVMPPARAPHLTPPAPRHSAPEPSRDTASYRFSVNGLTPLSLEVPALIGRKPRGPRVSTGQAPRLVRVSSPRQEVSGTHLGLRQHGSSVIVTDMHSTNGTVVTIPGAEPITLRPGDSLVAAPGTVVDIGDGNLVEILPTPRIATSDLASFERPTP